MLNEQEKIRKNGLREVSLVGGKELCDSRDRSRGKVSAY